MTAYIECSDVFKPYLVTFLQSTASDPKREFHGKFVCLILARLMERIGELLLSTIYLGFFHLFRMNWTLQLNYSGHDIVN